MVKFCLTCHQEFKVKPSHFERRKYCSQACMALAYQERLSGANNPNYKASSGKVCRYCGHVFHSYRKDVHYCSHKCSELASRKENRNSLPPPGFTADDRLFDKLWGLLRFPRIFDNACATCLATFRSRCQRKYCDDCRPRKPGPPVYQACGHCSATFRVTAGKKKYCSNACYHAASSELLRGENSHLWRGGKTEESRLVRGSAEYKRWRTTVFERDEYTCQVCSKRGGYLAAHHIKLFSSYIDLRFNVANGITLCRKCHLAIQWKESDYESRFIEIVWRKTLYKPTEVQLA